MTIDSGAEVPPTFAESCLRMGRVRFALLLVVLGALMLCCFPLVMGQWLARHFRARQARRRRYGR